MPSESAAAPPIRILIDLGLSVRRLQKVLATMDLSLDAIDAAVLTHLDTDHCHPSWRATGTSPSRGLPPHAALYVHAAHADRAARDGLNQRRITPITGPIVTPQGIRIAPLLAAHDEAGSCTFRFAAPASQQHDVGYITDIGQITTDLINHHRGVCLLAIESNYCPHLQASSNRPRFLKRRITGGFGHISNQEARDAIRAINRETVSVPSSSHPGRREPAHQLMLWPEPKPGAHVLTPPQQPPPTLQHVVLLHLSRQCNTPARAAAQHAHAPYGLTIATPDQPTPWLSTRTMDYAPAEADTDRSIAITSAHAPDAHPVGCALS
jgi:phosphoribosyl 1,2-cyclic phosphodiesterase